MKMMTATELRREVFAVLDQALKGRDILVRTRRGDIVLKRAVPAARSHESLRPKIAGRVKDDLDNADEAIRGHIVWPRA